MKKEQQKLTAELTENEINEYGEVAERLAKEKVVSKVHPVVQIDPVSLERKVCYISEPNYATKLAVMDKASTVGPYRAADELREACLIKEASDAITYSESPESDRYKLGVTEYCMGIVNRLQNQFKKK